MSDRIRSKAGRCWRQAAQSVPGPESNSNGNPHTAHIGSERKAMPLQQRAQSLWASRTGARQAAQRGGNAKFSTPPPRIRNPRSRIPPVTTDLPQNVERGGAWRPHKTTGVLPATPDLGAYSFSRRWKKPVG